MARRKIIWSHKAKIKLTEILDFYIDRNKSKTYSIKLHKQIQKNVRLLIKQPNLGIKTNDENIRALIIGEYIVFYEVAKDFVIVHTLWDCRQNPKDLIIK